jgi:hypothetical protein
MRQKFFLLCLWVLFISGASILLVAALSPGRQGYTLSFVRDALYAQNGTRPLSLPFLRSGDVQPSVTISNDGGTIPDFPTNTPTATLTPSLTVAVTPLSTVESTATGTATPTATGLATPIPTATVTATPQLADPQENFEDDVASWQVATDEANAGEIG